MSEPVYTYAVAYAHGSYEDKTRLEKLHEQIEALAQKGFWIHDVSHEFVPGTHRMISTVIMAREAYESV